jgi:hypothetical protein
VAPRHPWPCEAGIPATARCRGVPALAPVWPSPIQSTTPRPYNTLELMYKASWGLGCPFFYKLRAFVEGDRWRCPPPRTTAWLCQPRRMPQATQRSFQNIFTQEPSPQVALLVRIALHRSVPRPPKKPGSLLRSVASPKSSPFSPDQAKNANAEQGPRIQQVRAVRNEAGIWYHVHWEPVDEEAYKGSVSDKAELRDMLFNDNAQMQCKHCGHRHSYKPTNHFKNHLLEGLSLPFSPTSVPCTVAFQWPGWYLASFTRSPRHFF